MSKLNAYPLKQVHTDLFELVATIEGVGGAFETIRISKAALAAFILATAPGGSGGTAGVDGKNPEFQKSATHVQWRLVGDSTWIDLIPLASLKGADGVNGTNGTPGAPGVNGTNGGPFVWRGAHSGATAYVVGDAVSYSGGSYYCTAPVTGGLPTDTTKWGVLAAKGADGSGGGNISGNFTIPNNGVAVWQLPVGAAGMGAIYLATLGATPTTQFMFAGGAVNLMIDGGVAYKTVVLTGTTGSASAVSFSIVGDKLYVENRMGWDEAVCVFLSVAGVKQ